LQAVFTFVLTVWGGKSGMRGYVHMHAHTRARMQAHASLDVACMLGDSVPATRT
jgi:hypothetical protein